MLTLCCVKIFKWWPPCHEAGIFLGSTFIFRIYSSKNYYTEEVTNLLCSKTKFSSVKFLKIMHHGRVKIRAGNEGDWIWWYAFFKHFLFGSVQTENVINVGTILSWLLFSFALENLPHKSESVSKRNLDCIWRQTGRDENEFNFRWVTSWKTKHTKRILRYVLKIELSTRRLLANRA